MTIKDSSIKVISFDLDGTLTTKEFDEYIWETAIPTLYAEQHGISFGEAHKKVWDEYRTIPKNSLTWTDVKYWFDRFNFKKGWREVFDENKDRIRLYPDVKEVLNELKGKYKLIVITRSPHEFFEIKLSTAGLDGYFDRVFSTADFARGVKGGGVFKRVCKLLDIEPGEMLHVGDDPDFDVRMPATAGVTAVLIDRKGKTDAKKKIISRLSDVSSFL